MGEAAAPEASAPPKIPWTSEQATYLSIVYYGFCSSIMLVINKVAISRVPLPACVFFLQFVFTVGFIVVGKGLKILTVDDLSLGKIRRFAPYVVAFVLSIYTNGKVLQYSNIETLICFRACAPLFVSIMDWLFLGRELPSARSAVALVGVLSGAVMYVCCDADFRLHGFFAYSWVSAYLGVLVFEMTYAKHIVSSVEFASPVWGSVYYTNVLSLVPFACIALSSGEVEQLRLRVQPLTRIDLTALLICCMLGVCISWSGWNCRNRISAASYTLLGVVCKFMSILLNVLMWDKHATAGGLCGLVICLSASALYSQAPLRALPGQPAVSSSKCAEKV
eukprot:TRINITY_DN5150_c0_g1_i2.p1 TRINITY_DN5150_c0_g1~~TRINITY_DN5150_c0_g1_i2.p1  ORF type:complete len:335 (-),score=70.98 TRINITY_DN5150_c0_g1_i2:60-1064(-)